MNLDKLLLNAVVGDVTADVNKALKLRLEYQPFVCDVFKHTMTDLAVSHGYTFALDTEALTKLSHIIDNKVQDVLAVDTPTEAQKTAYSKKRNIGVVFSGGPAPGGHNVVAGIYDAAKKANPENVVRGFLVGPDGIIENETVELTDEIVNAYRNRGGFSMIKTGRTKIDSTVKMDFSRHTCKCLELDAVVIIGGDDSNTNAAFLAQELYNDGVQVVSVPKTIDGDMQVKDAEGRVLCAMSFGFHSAARAFAESISNLCTDASSDVKYWHVCKVMGRVASHLALEVAMQTHANITLIGEDLTDYVDEKRLAKAAAEGRVDYTAYGMTLRHLSRIICDGIVRRAKHGKNYGVMVIPEGLLEFINEIQVFIIKLNSIIADWNSTHDDDFHTSFKTLEAKREYLRRLAVRSREDNSFRIWNTRDDDLFNDIPEFFQEGLLMERDSHGNFPFSQVETEKVILGLVEDYLGILREQGEYRVGLSRRYYEKNMFEVGLDAGRYGAAIFENYAEADDYLLTHKNIISLKTLKNALEKALLVEAADEFPEAVARLYKKTVPDFKTQLHFYGYDGRGTDPTRFDCDYTYNLGQTVFALIVGGCTGQMAVIRNLEKGREHWEPVGVPIAPLMHLEERNGKLALVIEKSIVDLNSNIFRVFKAKRTTWLAYLTEDDHFRRPGPIMLYGEGEEDMPITLALNGLKA